MNDLQVKNAKPADKPYKMYDEKGLFLIVNPSGSKWWRFRYTLNGKQNTLSLGVYPKQTLGKARAKRDEFVDVLESGEDPAQLRKAEKNTVSETKREKAEAAKIEALIQAGEALPGSFEEIGNEWATMYLADKSEKYRNKVINRLKAEVYPFIGQVPVADVTAPMVLKVLQRIEARGIIESAH